MPAVPSTPDLSPFALGRWHVDPQLDTVAADGRSIKLEPRAMRVLCVLALASGGLVRTDELLDTVWPRVVVTPGSLYEVIAQLRKILGQDAIVTVPRKGYRMGALDLRHLLPVSEGASFVPSLGPYSLAILPWRARRVPDSHAFIRDSLLDDLIAELSRHPQLTVVALGTMLRYDGPGRPTARDVGHELGTANVVDGLLEVQQDMLSLRVQLVSTIQGTQKWIDTVEVPLVSWWETACVVVGRLARALNLELLGHGASAPALQGAEQARPRMLASRAWVELFARPETRAVTAQARAWAEQAMVLSPALAQASVCLAFCCWRESQFGWGEAPPATLRQLALEHAERAVSLDQRDPDAQYVLALVGYSLGQTARAEECLRHCLRLSGSHAPAHGLLALIRTRRGHPQDAAALCARAFALSPREPLRVVWYLALAWANLALQDYRAAFEASQQAMAVNPDFGTAYLTGAAAAQQLGATEEAHAWVALLRERTVFNSLRAVQERLPPAREPAHQAQMAQLLALLADAGLE